MALNSARHNQIEISKQLKISRCSVQNAIKKYKDLGRYDDLKRSGRPKKMNGQNIRHLKRLVNGDSYLCARKITSDLNNSLPKPVSVVTVRGYLKSLGYEYVVRVKKQWLSAKHRIQRVEWCQRYSGWTMMIGER